MRFRTYLNIGIIIITLCFGNIAGAADNALIADLEQNNGVKIKHSVHPVTGTVRMLRVDKDHSLDQPGALPKDATNDNAAKNFLVKYGSLFGIRNPHEELLLKKERSDEKGNTFIKYQQTHKGLPIIAGELIVQTDTAKKIRSVHGRTSPIATLDILPVITAEDAKKLAFELVKKQRDIKGATLVASEPVLSVYNPALMGHKKNVNSLVWRIEVTANEVLSIREFVLVDARTGFIALHFDQTDHAKYRKIYNNNNNAALTLPGTLARIEGALPTGNTETDNAYDLLGDAYDFYFTYHNRDSIDNKGKYLVATVRFCELFSCPVENAFWYPSKTQFVFGDGYAVDDVVGHEYTHGVTEYESGLYYYMQSGAISETFSDLWGEFIDLTNGKGSDTPDKRWLCGEDLAGGAIRNMKDPTIDYGGGSNPDKMSSPYYVCETSDYDNGGVHSNSGVNNKAVYLMTDGDTFNGITVTGIGIDKVAKLYYYVQTNLMTSGSDYEDLYNGLLLACDNLTGTAAGITVSDCLQVKNALDAVEMNTQPTACTMLDAPYCPANLSAVNIFYDGFETGLTNWSVAGTAGVWSRMNVYAANGTYAAAGDNKETVSDASLQMRTGKLIPANTYMRFNHAFEFQYSWGDALDGGVLEYSTDNGISWKDAETLFIYNGYNTKLYAGLNNPIGGRNAFGNASYGYTSSRLDLSTLAGQNVRFRFRIGTDIAGGSQGWMIDDVQIYQCLDRILPVDGTVTATKGVGQITVAWSGFSDVLNGIAQYKVAHSATGMPASSCASGTIFTVAGTDSQYIHTVDPAGNNFYRVCAVDNGGNVSTGATAGFAAVSVTKTGAGIGTVTSDLVGISCGSDCLESYPYNTVVQLTAVPATGSTFSGWTGACTGTDPVCTVTADAVKTAVANFSITTLTITPIKNYGGTITPATAVTVPYGSDKTITIAPMTGYHIEDVLADNVSAGAVTSYTFAAVTADHTIAVIFDKNVPDIVTGTISDFGVRDIGSSTAQTLTITNSGTANLTISAITFTGTNAGDFAKQSDLCSGKTVAPGANCTLQVVFKPVGEGARSATLNIQSNDIGMPLVALALTGSGLNTAPAASGLYLYPADFSSPIVKMVTLPAVYTDINGYADIKKAEIRINTDTSITNALFASYDGTTKKLTLYQDDGVTAVGSCAPGSGTLLSNSQGTLHCSGTKVTGSGGTLTILWTFTPKNVTWIGATKNVYLNVTDNTNITTGFQDKGNWTIFLTNALPSKTALTLTPEAANSAPGVAVTLTAGYSDSDGYRNIREAELLVSPTTGTSNVIRLKYDAVYNLLHIFNDAGTLSAGSCAPGEARTISNSRGTLDCALTTVTPGVNDLSIAWNITAKALYDTTAVKKVFLKTTDYSGTTTALVQKGIWLITTTSSSISLSPTSLSTASGSEQIFTAVYTDPTGVTDIKTAEFLVSPTSSTSSAILIKYDRVQNLIQLFNDGGTLVQDSCTPGTSKIMENSRGSINCAATTVTTAGNNIQLVLPVTAKTLFASTVVPPVAKKVLLRAVENSGKTTGWIQRGTWLIAN